MSSLLIHNVGTMVSGDVTRPFLDRTQLYVEDGLIREVGTARVVADVVVDANGLTLTPGLVDGHTHPVFGDFGPPQNSVGWMETYLHGGVTTMVSAGEVHVPGFPLAAADPKLNRYLAVLASRCWATYRPGGLKVVAGTMLLVPSMCEADFDELVEEGCRVVKFIFFPYEERLAEAQSYSRWARARA